MTAYQFEDAQRQVVDYLDAKMSTTVGAFYPQSSTDAPELPFLQVGWDGTPTVEYPITQRATIRLTAWASQPTQAKQILAEAQGRMLTHTDTDGIWAIHALTGPLPVRDPDTGLHLVSATFRVAVRSTPLPA